MEAYIGEIRMFGFGWPPRGFAPCDGNLLRINQNHALFSLLQTSYGGDGRTTFALPDLRGRMPVSAGNSLGSPLDLEIGQKGGEEITFEPAKGSPTSRTLTVNPCLAINFCIALEPNIYPSKA